MTVKAVLEGLASHVPGVWSLGLSNPGGTLSARYCYSVWLRHMVMAADAGVSTTPMAVAELGPADSLGTGLAALLCGAQRYSAFDVVPYAHSENNIRVLEELLELFGKGADIPDEDEFPAVKPYLERYDFPRSLLPRALLKATLRAERVDEIRNSLRNLGELVLCNHDANAISISYVGSWWDPSIVDDESIDMIYSQAVLEHVTDLPGTYRAMYRWLRPGGFMSHQIDLRSHRKAREWNGHWAYSDRTWKVITGSRPWFLNREPRSKHLELLSASGFEVVTDVKYRTESGIARHQLSPRFRHLSDDDLGVSGAFVQAVK